MGTEDRRFRVRPEIMIAQVLHVDARPIIAPGFKPSFILRSLSGRVIVVNPTHVKHQGLQRLFKFGPALI